MNWKVLFLLISIVIVEILAGFVITKATKLDKKHKMFYFFLILGVIFYISIAFILYIMVKTEGSLAIVNTLWQGFNIILISFFAVLYFKEKLQLIQIIGIIFTFIGMILVNLKIKNKKIVFN